MLYENIKKLVQYGVETGLTPACEKNYTINLLLDVFKEDEYVEPEEEYRDIDLEEVLNALLDEAVKRNLIEDSVVYRDPFEAFLPADKKERKLILEELKNETRTIILYEAPHRLVRTLEELKETLGNRRMTLCRELTKRHETAFHTTIEELILYYQTEKPLGECVLVIEGRSRQEMEEEQKASWEKITIEEHMEIYENQGHSRKEAMRMVANDRGMTKRDVYQYLINKTEE